MGYQGWAIYADGDMVCLADIAELWNLQDPGEAVMVVKHDYKTKHATKYLGNVNQDYPRKNWSSVILWNCGHPSNRELTPASIAKADGAYLHRFQWLDEIGELPLEWNHLVSEYPVNPEAKLLHYTIGSPCFPEYATGEYAGEWHNERTRSQIPCAI